MAETTPKFLDSTLVKKLLTKIKEKIDAAVKSLKDAITGADGKVLSIALPVATAEAIGAVKAGTGISIAADGTISANGDGVTAITEAELNTIFNEVWPVA